MITEIAILNIKEGLSEAFEINFKEASSILSNSKGFMNYELLKCIEEDNKYLLIVRWESIEDHLIGFRQSDDYLKWKKLLHHFYDPFPTVEHYENL